MEIEVEIYRYSKLTEVVEMEVAVAIDVKAISKTRTLQSKGMELFRKLRKLYILAELWKCVGKIGH